MLRAEKTHVERKLPRCARTVDHSKLNEFSTLTTQSDVLDVEPRRTDRYQNALSIPPCTLDGCLEI